MDGNIKMNDVCEMVKRGDLDAINTPETIKYLNKQHAIHMTKQVIELLPDDYPPAVLYEFFLLFKKHELPLIPYSMDPSVNNNAERQTLMYFYIVAKLVWYQTKQNLVHCCFFLSI